MCQRPSLVIPEREGVAVIQAKENVPTSLMVRVLVRPCACGEGWMARSPGNAVWSRAEQIKKEK